jgi:hypothetical protein
MARIPRIMDSTPLVPARAPALPATPDTRGFSIDLAPSMRAQRPVEIDERGFVAEAAGIGQIGRGIERTGDALFQAEKAQQDMINLRKEHDAVTALEQFDAELDVAKQSELDETKWPAIAERIAAKAASTILDPAKNPLSPAAREAITDRITQWQTRKVAAAKIDSIRTSHTRAADAVSAQIMTAINNRDWGTAETLTQQGIASKLLPATQLPKVQGLVINAKEQAEREAKAAAEQQAQMALLAKAEADPDATEQEIQSEQWRSGKTLSDVSTAQQIVNSVRARRMNDAADVFSGFTAKPIAEQTRAGLEAALPNGLRPADRAKFLGAFDQMAAERAKADYNTPEAITARFGKMLDAVDAYDLEKLGGQGSQEARDRYVDVMTAAETLPENLRGKITGPMNDKWNARPPAVSDVVETFKNDRIRTMYENGELGAFKIKDSVTGQEKIDTEMQKIAQTRMANLRMELDAWLEDMPNARPQDVLEQINKMARITMRETDAQRILDTIKPSTVGQPNPATWFNIRGRLERAQGMPDTGEPPDATLFSPQSAPGQEGGPIRKISAQQPGGAQGAVGATGPQARTTGRVTSYGYPNDETPDTYSSMGIGSFSGQEAIRAAKRGDSHPMQLQAGDIAVSPDKERELRAAGIRPGDEIELTYSDGRTHRGRWMDRTSKRLRGRWDLYTPGGPSPLNDTPVTSFRKL